MSFRAASNGPPLRTVVPAVLLLALSASPAAATCGDYLHIRPAGQPAAHADRSAPERPADGRPPAPHPCADGACERAPAPAWPAPVPPPSDGGSGHDALLAAGLGLDPPAGGCGWADPAAEPRHVPTSVFHPPRV